MKKIFLLAGPLLAFLLVGCSSPSVPTQPSAPVFKASNLSVGWWRPSPALADLLGLTFNGPLVEEGCVEKQVSHLFVVDRNKATHPLADGDLCTGPLQVAVNGDRVYWFNESTFEVESSSLLGASGWKATTHNGIVRQLIVSDGQLYALMGGGRFPPYQHMSVWQYNLANGTPRQIGALADSNIMPALFAQPAGVRVLIGLDPGVGVIDYDAHDPNRNQSSTFGGNGFLQISSTSFLLEMRQECPADQVNRLDLYSPPDMVPNVYELPKCESVDNALALPAGQLLVSATGVLQLVSVRQTLWQRTLASGQVIAMAANNQAGIVALVLYNNTVELDALGVTSSTPLKTFQTTGLGVPNAGQLVLDGHRCYVMQQDAHGHGMLFALDL